MKKIFILLLLTACYQNDDGCKLCDIDVEEKYDYICDECDKIEFKMTSPQYIMEYLCKEIVYEKSKKTWYLPEWTWENKRGDCVEIVILWMYLIETRTEFLTNMYVVENFDGSYHAIAKINDIFYDVNSGIYFTEDKLYEYYESVKYIISYPEIIWMTYYYGKNVGKYY